MERLDLLQYTIKKNVAASVQEAQNQAKISGELAKTTELHKVNYAPVQSDVAVFGGREVSLFEDLNNIVFQSPQKPIESIKLSTTSKDLKPEEISHIKLTIYNYVHDRTFIDSEYGLFNNANSMFAYLNRVSNGEITKETGISRAQLIKLTQNDVAEDANGDFFGTLNRIFNNKNFNKDKNGILSFDEINEFIGYQLGSDALHFWEKVNEYSNQIQEEYETLSNQEKLEYVIDRTREYLEAAGLTKQIAALDRLIGMEDIANQEYDAKVGQIVMAPIESEIVGYITLGAYSSSIFPYKYYSNSENSSLPYTGGMFAFDNDEEDIDRGITLNSCLLEDNWYELVDTLVHELTHATAYQYYPVPSCEPIEGSDGRYKIFYSYDQLETISDLLEKDGLYDFYCDNFEEIVLNQELTIPTGEHQGENAYERFLYLLECRWGEYAAYQVDADFVDSIAGDIFDYRTGTNSANYFGNWGMTTAVDGVDEKTTIDEHIQDGYNSAGMSLEEYASAYGIDVSDIVDKDENGIISDGDTVDGYDIYSREVKPDWDWWTYGKYQGWTA